MGEFIGVFLKRRAALVSLKYIFFAAAASMFLFMSSGSISLASDDGKTAITEKDVTINIANKDNIIYDGVEKRPAISLVYKGATLDPADYTLAYSDNINVGEGQVTISFKSNSKYTGSITAKFNIKKATFAKNGITDSIYLIYGSQINETLDALVPSQKLPEQYEIGPVKIKQDASSIFLSQPYGTGKNMAIRIANDKGRVGRFAEIQFPLYCDNYSTFNMTLLVFVIDYPVITLEPAGGKVDPETITADANGRIGALPTPEKEYYTFDGWFLSSTDEKPVAPDRIYDKDTTLFARWSHEHTWSAYKYDDSVHYKECTLCFELSEVEYHTMSDWYVAAQPGSIKTGHENRTCPVCGYTDSADLAARGKTGTTGSGTPSGAVQGGGAAVGEAAGQVLQETAEAAEAAGEVLADAAGAAGEAIAAAGDAVEDQGVSVSEKAEELNNTLNAMSGKLPTWAIAALIGLGVLLTAGIILGVMALAG